MINPMPNCRERKENTTSRRRVAKYMRIIQLSKEENR